MAKESWQRADHARSMKMNLWGIVALGFMLATLSTNLWWLAAVGLGCGALLVTTACQTLQAALRDGEEAVAEAKKA